MDFLAEDNIIAYDCNVPNKTMPCINYMQGYMDFCLFVITVQIFEHFITFYSHLLIVQ